MYTSLFLVAVGSVSLGVEAEPGAVRWQSQYRSARAAARTTDKPLAIFFGPGQRGWQALTRDAGLSQESLDLLRSEYIALHVDTRDGAGKARAEEFEVSGGVGLVISDRGGSVQAFHHDGRLAAEEVARYLRRYANGYTVRTTESVAGERAAAAPPVQVFYSRGGC